jgi:hypothetical protein
VAWASGPGRHPFHQTTLQLRSRDRRGSIVTGKLEVQTVPVNGDSETGRPFRQMEYLPERWLSQFVVAALEPKQNAAALVGNQS